MEENIAVGEHIVEEDVEIEEDTEMEENIVLEDGDSVLPVVSEEFKPKVGMEFDSFDAAYAFYNSYAFKAGFGIRNHTSNKSTIDGGFLWKALVCCKQGKKKKKDGVAKRKWAETRTNCMARVVVLKPSGCDKYVFNVIEEKHNHRMTTPDKVHLYRSHRGDSVVKKVMIEQCSSVNISMSKQVSLLDVQSEGMEKDRYNVESALRAYLIGHDAKMLHEHFMAEQEKNKSFYFKMEFDETQTLGNFFWTDASSRRAYAFFGDVIVFDMTYNTNRYGMKFALLIGVNNHGQMIVLGCGFLTSETSRDIEWLFEEFLNVMSGEPPKVIITDQDDAITKAIVSKLPTTFHRYCIWHITNKFSEKPMLKKIFSDLHDCIWDIESKEEFEVRWNNLVEENVLHDDEWLRELYNLRENWVPAFVKHVFSAEMSSSHLAESCHAFFKQYVDRKNSLTEFIVRFNRALVCQRHKELIADHDDENSSPPMQLCTPMEAQMAKLYTREIFKKFQVEELKSVSCFVKVIMSDDNKEVYEVVERVTPGIPKVKRVVYDKGLDYARCSCKDMEFRGIPCRHILTLLRMKQVELLPEQYILNRWLKTAKNSSVFYAEDNQIKEVVDGSMMLRKARLSKGASELIDLAVMSEQASELVSRTFEVLQGQINAILGDGARLGKRKQGEGPGSSSQKEVFNDPRKVKTKKASENSKSVKGKQGGTSGQRASHLSDNTERTQPTQSTQTADALLEEFYKSILE